MLSALASLVLLVVLVVSHPEIVYNRISDEGIIMDRTEYESRLRALDQRLESSIEVLRAAHRIERRALDYLWMTSPGNREGSVAAPGLSIEPSAAQLVGSAPAPAVAAMAVAPARRPRHWRSSDLADRVLDLLDELPENFSRDDVLVRLGDPPPERSMLYRVFRDLVWHQVLAVAQNANGRTPVLYRDVRPFEEDEGEEAAAAEG